MVYFNFDSTDEKRCVGSVNGAVGYVTMCPKGGCIKYGDVKSLTYQGVKGRADSIKNGRHVFWTTPCLYGRETQFSKIDTVIGALVSQRRQSAKIIRAFLGDF